MMPLRLSLTNFMCYRDNLSPLELEGIHLACICGNNGNGKSALLDAITWALWGEARAKTQEELIHQGQQDMAVELEFMARGQRYKVVRKHSRSGRSRQGTTILELYVASDNGFRAITGNTIRETGASIRDLLHMEYSTFISSAYLLQGQADLFTASLPSERKRILGEILDLAYYDVLETKAKELSRQREADIRETEIALQYMNQELERRPEYESRLKDANEALHQLSPQVEEAQKKAENLQRSVASLQGNKQEMDGLERQIQNARQETAHFQKQVNEHHQRIAKFETVLQKAEAGALTKARLEAEEVEKRRETLREKTEEVQKSASEIHRLKAANAKILNEMKELRTKFDLLSEEQAKCPVCKQPLGPDGMEHLRAELESQGKDQKQIYRENETQINQLEAQRQALSAQVSETEKELDKRRRETQANLITLEREIEEAQRSLPDERTKLQQSQGMLDRRRQEVEEGMKRLEAMKREMEGLPELELSLKKAQNELKGLSNNQLSLMSEKRTLEQRLEECERLQKETAEKQRAITKLQREKSIYDELAVAFGKSGVQALIIESATPQLQDDANELLGRLTDNRMSLKLETQRERKTRQGDPIETLEIKIADELGTRSYETFSGGETFRVNFALRIALSKLLARRAGAPLPILFIDEGFGTQDASGRERLLEAIKSIENEFEKIFVITHIEELKDAFPVRIEVTKTEAGSTYAIS